MPSNQVISTYKREVLLSGIYGLVISTTDNYKYVRMFAIIEGSIEEITGMVAGVIGHKLHRDMIRVKGCNFCPVSAIGDEVSVAIGEEIRCKKL